MVSVFGAHMVPVIVVGGISLLLVLVKSNTAGSIAVSITIAFSITAIPIYLISNLLSKRPQAVDPLYGYLLYVVSAGLSFAILFTIRSEEHTSELQSRGHLVCRLLLETKK